MKVLYITSLFLKKASSASIRNVSLVNGLAQNNCQVDVLTLNYPIEYGDDFLKKLLEPNIRVIKSKNKFLYKYLEKNKMKGEGVLKRSYLKRLKNLFKGIIKDFYFFPDVDKEWIQTFQNEKINVNDYDLIISSSDTKTSHYIAEKINKQNKAIPWYQIWGDPWHDDIGLKGLRKIRAKFKEKSLLKKADKIFYVSKPTLKIMKSKMKNLSSKMNFLPRGYLMEVESESKKYNKKINFLYTGVMNKNRNINNFLNIVNNDLVYRDIIQVEIYGNVSGDLITEMKKFKFINIHEPVSYKKIVEKYKENDILIFTDNGFSTTQIPGKLYDYFGTDKKILCLMSDIDSEISNFIKSFKRCIVIQDGNKISIEEIINSKLNQKIITKFKGENIAKELLREYDENKK